MISFRREKFVPFGGPSGGDGGKGGDVILVSTRDLTTLYDLSFRRRYIAEAGGKGLAKDMFGADGHDCEIRVPVGTLVRTEETGDLLVDLSQDGMRHVIAKGGRGGRGNARFASSVRRAPRVAEKGEPGQALRLRLELKLLADVGLVGLPNAGKSTFLRAVSKARPKVADYPFTTLVPSLGIVKVEGLPAFCMADLPGLIEGAHLGAGLGVHFLKHIQRTKILLHLVDLSFPEADSAEPAEKKPRKEDLLASFKTVRSELEAFDPTLAERPLVVAATKMDLPEARERYKRFASRIRKLGFQVFPVSGATGEGVDDVLKALCEILDSLPAVEEPVVPRIQEIRYLPPFEIEKEGEHLLRVSGTEIERLVAMTDFTNEEAVGMFKKRLRRLGFIDQLSRCRGEPEDAVVIGEMEFAYREFFE